MECAVQDISRQADPAWVRMPALEEQDHLGQEPARVARWHRMVRAPRSVTERWPPHSEEQPQSGSIPFEGLAVLPFPAWEQPVSEAVWVFPV